jgi:hypothetical protein
MIPLVDAQHINPDLSIAPIWPQLLKEFLQAGSYILLAAVQFHLAGLLLVTPAVGDGSIYGNSAGTSSKNMVDRTGILLVKCGARQDLQQADFLDGLV